MAPDTAATVEVEWCDEANGAYIVVCSTHGVVDHAPTEAEAEDQAAAHRLADRPGSAAAWTAQCPWVVECHEHGFIDGAFQSMYLAGKRRDQHLADEHGVAIALRYKPVAEVPDAD